MDVFPCIVLLTILISSFHTTFASDTGDGSLSDKEKTKLGQQKSQLPKNLTDICLVNVVCKYCDTENGCSSDMDIHKYTGPKGDTGTMGPMGRAGSKGDTGTTGPMGPAGQKGEKGTAGQKGSVGQKGDTGTAGQKGSDGPKGDTGTTGPMGPAGPKGDTVTTGPMGPAGPPGKCSTPNVPPPPCAVGTCDKNPGVSCKSMHEIEKEDRTPQEGEYYLNKKEPLHLKCDFKLLTMCKSYSKKPSMQDIESNGRRISGQEIWLSRLDFDVLKFSELKWSHLNWFQQLSNGSLVQKIRIYKKNFIVNSESFEILSWYGSIIKLQQNINSPKSYTVKLDDNTCKDDSVPEGYTCTDITIQGTPIDLPIRDFRIVKSDATTEQRILPVPMELCAHYDV